MLNRDQLLDLTVTRYFGGLNDHKIDVVMGTMAENCVMWFPAAAFNYQGEDALRIHMEDFLGNFPTVDFHDFVNVVDEETQSVVSYFTVRLVDGENNEVSMRNLNVFHTDNNGQLKEVIIYNSKPLDKGFQAGNS